MKTKQSGVSAELEENKKSLKAAKRTAIVTGATSGIGLSIAQIFAKRNIPLVISGRQEDKLNQFITTFEKDNKNIYSWTGDITEQKTIDGLFDFTYNSCKLVPNVYILSAGCGLPGTILSSNASKWEHLINLNYLSVIRQLRVIGELFLKQAKENDSAFPHDIVVIGSVVGREVSKANPVYGSTKFAVHSLVESLRQELCSYNIRVTLIEPGFVRTGFQEAANYDKEFVQKICDDIGPLLTPDDVAKTIEFVIDQPMHVHLDDIRIRPTRQKV